jgi:hypothetical protein
MVRWKVKAIVTERLIAEVFILNLGCYLRVLSLDLPLSSLLASQLFKTFLAPRGGHGPGWP